MCVTHKEYIKDIQGSTTFQLTELPLNPGLGSSFPWLAQMADAYEEYRIKGMVFEFKSLSSEFTVSANVATGNNGALGAVIMATNYNAARSPAFNNKKEMENYEHAQSAPPTRSQIHAVECKGQGTVLKTLYLRTGATEPGTDIRLYDIGNFGIATQGMQESAGATIGELWVAYEVEFYKPRYRPGGARMDHFALRYNAASPSSTNLVGGSTAVHLFGDAPRIDRTTPVLTPANPNNGVFGAGSYVINDAGTDSKLFLPENPGGWYRISVYIRCDDAFGQLRPDGAQPSFGIGTLQSCTQIGNWYGNWSRTASQAPFETGGAGTEESREWTFSLIVNVLPFDQTSLPFIELNLTNPPVVSDYTLDILVEEVNPQYFTNPSA